jgi:crotonobetainyl-CoA:carnitine CoA-transferase CaiB-like acyl-CoA transferase
LLGKPIAAARVAEVEKAADSARLLAVGIRHRSRYQSVPNVLEAGTLNHAVSQARWKIVDWSNLWAGPWATGYLAATGADITHVEAPHRRDGYLQTRAGREVWMRFNEMKQRVLLDARVVSDRVRLERLLMGADLLVSGHTLRVLPQLGFDDEWFSRAATGLCRLSLVAYEGDREGLPGLGEHAAAIAGLLLTDAGRPRPPRPWADPLLGAWAVVIALAMRRARVRGAHVRLSLEAAASRVLTPEVGKVFLKPNLGPS